MGQKIKFTKEVILMENKHTCSTLLLKIGKLKTQWNITTHFRMAKLFVQKTSNNKYCQEYGAIGTLISS